MDGPSESPNPLMLNNEHISEKEASNGQNLHPSPRRNPSRALRRFDSLDVESNTVSELNTHAQALSMAVILRLAYESIGVVYGDIGTSPLYVFSSTFQNGLDESDPSYKNDILGALSLIIYTLTLIPVIKYVLIVLWANDNGDGGTFALYSLICRHAKVSIFGNQQTEDQNLSSYKLHMLPSQTSTAKKLKNWMENNFTAKMILLFLALLGTCMVIGDGVLTPAISVISAVNGIQRATPKLDQNSVVIISVIILIIIFCVQRFGTSRIGFAFAPVVLIWFSFIGVIGLYNIFKHDPTIFKAFNPYYIFDYFRRNKKDGWISLGGIVLCITGTEAMFADLGHFTVRSIQLSFCCIAYPCLLFAYIGQAAYLMTNPGSVGESFYASIPEIVYWPQFVVAVGAAIIASQAMISATFTVVKQSMSLGCFPRVKVVHTSSKVAGQVYIPEMNWILMLACVAVTVGFKTTTKLGNAYGIAVVGVMVVTTVLVSLIMIIIWQKSLVLVMAFLVGFGAMDLVYFSAVLYKIDQGGYLPLVFASVLMCVMSVWYYVSVMRYQYEVKNKLSLETVTERMSEATRVLGVGLVYTELAQGVPTIFAHMLENLPAMHEVVAFVAVKFLLVTHVQEEERFLVRRVGPPNLHMYRCVARYGYREIPPDYQVFERQLLDCLSRFITLQSNYKIQDIEGHHAGTTSSPTFDVDGVARTVEVVEEVRAMTKAWEKGVVYFLGRSEVRASENSSALRRFVINYAYDALRRNCRKNSVALKVPQLRLLEVGMIYNI